MVQISPTHFQPINYANYKTKLCTPSRNRTGMNLSVRGILSPLRLPVSPSEQEEVY